MRSQSCDAYVSAQGDGKSEREVVLIVRSKNRSTLQAKCPQLKQSMLANPVAPESSQRLTTILYKTVIANLKSCSTSSPTHILTGWTRLFSGILEAVQGRQRFSISTMPFRWWNGMARVPRMPLHSSAGGTRWELLDNFTSQMIESEEMWDAVANSAAWILKTAGKERSKRNLPKTLQN